MTALAIRDDQTQFDSFQIAVLRQSGVDEDVSNAELAAFLHTCQRRQLDPFAQQIYLIGRYDKSKGRKVYKAQTSIDGFRLIARRAAERSGIDYEYEDTVWFDAKGGRHEVWLGDGPPAAAKVVVVRNGRRFDAVARYAAYVQTNNRGELRGLWKTMADTLVAKCAEALALRKAFPEDLGGLYTAEEMGQADNPVDGRPATVQGHVVREDAMAATNGNGRTDVVTDEKWIADLRSRISKVADATEGNRLWAEINEKRDAGQCSPADLAALREMIVDHVKAAEAHAKAEAEHPDDVVEGQVVGQSDAPTDKQHAHMHALWPEAGFANDRDGRIRFTRQIIDRDIDSSSELTGAEADQVIERLRRYVQQNTPPAEAFGDQPDDSPGNGAEDVEKRIAAAATLDEISQVKAEVMAAFKAQRFDPKTGNGLLRSIKAKQYELEETAA